MALDNTTLFVLRALQSLIGAADAEKGFHAHGDTLRARVRVEEGVRSNGGGEYLHLVRGNLRDYYTARLALITTEVAEAIEELRNGRAVDETHYPTAVNGSNIHNIRDGLMSAELKLKPEGVPSELADVVIRAFDFADEASIDLAAMIDEKLAYNATRPFKHGRTM